MTKCTFIKSRFRVYVSASEVAAEAMKEKIWGASHIFNKMSQPPQLITEIPDAKGVQRQTFRKYIVEVYYGFDIHGEAFAKALEELQLFVNPITKGYIVMRPQPQPVQTTKLVERVGW